MITIIIRAKQTWSHHSQKSDALITFRKKSSRFQVFVSLSLNSSTSWERSAALLGQNMVCESYVMPLIQLCATNSPMFVPTPPWPLLPDQSVLHSPPPSPPPHSSTPGASHPSVMAKIIQTNGSPHFASAHLPTHFHSTVCKKSLRF